MVAGPVLPWQPPMTLEQTTKYWFVSKTGPGPTSGSHQPSSGSSGRGSRSGSRRSGCGRSRIALSRGRQPPVRLVGDGHRLQRLAALQHERLVFGEGEVLHVPARLDFVEGAGRRSGGPAGARAGRRDAARRTGSMAGPPARSAAAPPPYATRSPTAARSASSKSSMMSSTCSMPMDSRMRSGRDARGPLLLFGQLLVRGASRVDDQRLGVAHVGQVREQLDAVDEAAAGLEAALDAEGEDGAGAFGQVLAGQLVGTGGRAGRDS